ncbi:MAG: RluA family pseudouridine synthase [Archangium sp.]|nr:RluA family pseudouridine synthase [Archangium sp.]
MAVRRLTVPAGAGPRLDAFLTKAVPGFSKVQVQRLLADGRVKVNGKKAKPMRRIVGGEEVELDLPEVQKAPAAPDGPKLRALYEDAKWLVIDKPSGLVVEPERGQASVVGLAAAQFGGFNVGGVAQPGVAHRLDKDTTGCLLLSKTDDALGELKQAFEEKRVGKTYLALVWGVPPEAGKLDQPYGRHPEDPRRYTTRFPSARKARLSWKRLEQFGEEAALVEINLDTGRTHQIRAQFADLGHPVLGDWLYGTAAAKAAGFGRFALHAARLALEGLTKKPLTLEAPLPEDFKSALDALRAKSGRS